MHRQTQSLSFARVCTSEQHLFPSYVITCSRFAKLGFRLTNKNSVAIRARGFFIRRGRRWWYISARSPWYRMRHSRNWLSRRTRRSLVYKISTSSLVHQFRIKWRMRELSRELFQARVEESNGTNFRKRPSARIEMKYSERGKRGRVDNPGEIFRLHSWKRSTCSKTCLSARLHVSCFHM